MLPKLSVSTVHSCPTTCAMKKQSGQVSHLRKKMTAISLNTVCDKLFIKMDEPAV